MSTVVIISGANRGLGKGLLERYLQLPDHTVIAANRNPNHPTSKELFDLPKAENSKLIIVKVDATIWQDAFEAVKSLEAQGIDHIDIAIANAGVAYAYPSVATITQDELAGHIGPNVYGLTSFYQATRPLLQKSKKEPIFAPMGTTAGSLTTRLPFPNSAYGPSKAAAAWLTIQIDIEEPWLNSISLAPGWVHTELGDGGAKIFGVDEATIKQMMISVKESVDGMVQVLSKSSKAEHGGKLVLYNGDILPW